MMAKVTPWVKWFPGDFLNGVSDLEANEGWVYVVVLNLIYDKQAPWPYDPKRLARRCRLRQNVVEEAVESLIEYEKLSLVDGALTNEKAEKVIGKRQEIVRKASDAANARWQDGSGKSKENKGGDDADAMRKASGSDAILEARDQKPDKRARARKQDDDLKLEGGAATSPAQAAFDLYNELAARVGGVVHGKLTENWKRSLLARMDGGGLEEWRRALAMVERSAFLCGEARVRPGEAPFKLSLPTLIRPDNYQKLLDGFYGTDREPPAPKEGADPKTWSRGRWERILEIYSVSGSWPDDAGPEPGKPGYLGPPTGDDYGRQ